MRKNIIEKLRIVSGAICGAVNVSGGDPDEKRWLFDSEFIEADGNGCQLVVNADAVDEGSGTVFKSKADVDDAEDEAFMVAESIRDAFNELEDTDRWYVHGEPNYWYANGDSDADREGDDDELPVTVQFCIFDY